MNEKVRLWLDEHADGRVPVFLASEIPEDVLASLRRRDLVIHVPGGVVVLRAPGDVSADVIRSLVWPITEAIATAYAPAVVERDSAVRLYLGRTDPGPEIRIRQTGKTRWREEIAPGVVIRVERGDVTASEVLPVGEASVPVDGPEEVLLSLPLQFLREGGLHDVALWMKSLVLSHPRLTDAYRRRPRPVVLKRMEHIARDVGNERLADVISDVVMEEQEVRIGRDRTEIGRALVVPALVAASGTTHRPWLDRLRVLIRESREQVRDTLADFGVPPPSRDLHTLLVEARASKADDAYHSTSIEGYRLRLDQVSALLGDDLVGGGLADGPGIEDVRSKLAVVGYSTAFDGLIRRIGDAVAGMPLTGSLALDLYTELFTPSVEAGIVSADMLRGWRGSPVFIRDTLFVPPASDKVGAMIDLLFEEISEIEMSEGLLRAVLVHLWFVWIHPFPDGNGRVARLLMNAALLSGGLPWLTIRVGQRAEYFAALQQSQLKEVHAAFASFIASSFKEP